MQASVEEGRRSINKVKRFNQGTQLLKQGKSSKAQEHLSFSTDLARGVTDINENKQCAITNQVSLPTKVRNRRKLSLQKALARKESKPIESIGDDHPDSYSLQANKRMLDSKVIHASFSFVQLYTISDFRSLIISILLCNSGKAFSLPISSTAAQMVYL